MKSIRETLDQLDEITRRDLLKGAGAAAVGAAGLAPKPAKAWFFFLVPLPNTNPDAAANACMPPTVQVGQKVMHQGELQVVQKIHGVSNRCQNPNMPVAVTVGKPEPVGDPVANVPPNQTGTSKSYAQKIIEKIKPNISFYGEIQGNPAAEVLVKCNPDGLIQGIRLVKSSGYKDWDQAVITAIEKTGTIPKDIDGFVIPEMILAFYPYVGDSTSRSGSDSELDAKRRENLKRIQGLAAGTNEESLDEASPEALSKIDKLFDK